MSLRWSLILVVLVQVGSLVASDNTTAEGGLPPYPQQYLIREPEPEDWFPHARWFISLVLEQSDTIDIIYNMTHGGKEVKFEEIRIAVTNEKGLIACISFALILVIIIPIIGLFFCCCRLCGNCGGTYNQRISTAKNSSRRYFFIGSLLVLLTLILLGNVSLFMASSKLKTAYDNVQSTLTNSLNDANSFVQNTIQQVDYLKNISLLVPMDGIKRDLSEMDKFGEKVQSEFNKDALFTQTIDLSKAITNEIQNASTILKSSDEKLKNLNKDVVKFKADYKNFQDILDISKTDCKRKTPGNPDCDKLNIKNIDIDINNLDWKLDLSAVQTAKNHIETAITNTETEYEKFPSTLQQKTAKEVKEILDQLSTFRSKVEDSTSFLNTMNGNVQNQTNTLKDNINYDKENIRKINHYVYQGTIGISALIGLIWLLLCLGLFGGMCCYQSHKLPTERSCSSNFSGIMIMTGIGLIFIFSSLLWLLTIPLFVVGSTAQIYVCEPLFEDPDFPSITRYWSKFANMDPDKLLSNALFPNKSVSLNVSSVLSECKNNQTLYTAFQLYHVNSIDEALNYTQHTNLEKFLDDLPKSIEKVEVLNKDFDKQMEAAKTALDIRIPDFVDDLKQFDVSQALTDLKTVVDSICTNDDLNGNCPTLEANIVTLQMKSVEFMDTKKMITELIDEMKKVNQTVQAKAVDLFDNIGKLQARLNNDIPVFIVSFTKKKLDKIREGVDSAVNKTKFEVGGCKPVWNLFDASRTLLCKDLLDPLNGFWFGLGWCLFMFLPALIFGVKIAKYYRRMKHIPDDWNDTSDFLTEDAPLTMLKNPYEGADLQRRYPHPYENSMALNEFESSKQPRYPPPTYRKEYNPPYY